jgi:pimeloyl-ACP methyl ester carboxylesterase
MPVLTERSYLKGCFFVEHQPTHPQTTAIVILPPLGYEDTSAYRPLKLLAEALAEQNYLVVRLDWPGLGDSFGDALDADITERRQESIKQLIASLKNRGFKKVAGIGVRAGGILALQAAVFDDLVLWGVPLSGKAYLREEKAFHRLAAKAFSEKPADAAPVPEGALEAGGFLYSKETVAALEKIQVQEFLKGYERVLWIGREGSTPPADVTASTAGGLGELLEDPYRSVLNPQVKAEILAWFPMGGATFAPGKLEGAPLLKGDGWVERPVLFEGSAGLLSGIFCEPAGKNSTHWTIFFNAGGVRRSGPNRLWTCAARAIAREGHASLRLDVRDVGDSDGASLPHTDLEAMYSEASISDAVEAVDQLRARGATLIDVVGLCSGAFMCIQVAARRDIRQAILFNCLAYVWNDDARATGVTSQLGRSLFNTRRWKRLLTGKINAKEVAKAILSRAQLQAKESLKRLQGQPPASEVDLLIQNVRQRTQLQLVSSEGDPSIDYLYRHVPPDRIPPLTVIPCVDHTIRPSWAHDRVVTLIKESLSVAGSATDQRRMVG